MKRFIVAFAVFAILFSTLGMPQAVWSDVRVPGQPYTGPAPRPEPDPPQPPPGPIVLPEEESPTPAPPPPTPVKKRTCGVFGMADMTVFLFVFGAGFCLRNIARRAKDDDA